MESLLAIIAVIAVVFIAGKVLKFTGKMIFAVICLGIAVVICTQFGIL